MLNVVGKMIWSKTESIVGGDRRIRLNLKKAIVQIAEKKINFG